MTHKKAKELRFYTLSCPDCGGPLINYDEDGVEYVLMFRNRALADIEAAEMTEEGDQPGGVIEVELKVVDHAEK
jgi:hypothetical protein